uniref:Uncharacterized protein n=1 Tax=Vitis vinifera TaxID=29760 RepID=A5B499_VITVI|nr:hypothetical protein VITISV_026949 [Vitis vinifera]
MSTEQGNASKRFLGEATEQHAEEEVESMTSKESSSSSSDGSSQPQQNENSDISNSTCPASSSMPPRSNVITGASNAQFVNTPLHQQYLTSLPSTPLPGTPQSIAPTTMDLLPQTGGLQPFQLGQDINQITNIPQQNVIQNEQFLLSRHMSMVNAGNSQVPANQPARNMRNPYGAASNSYYYPTSNLPADYRLDPSPRPQMGIGATSPFIRARMAQMQQNYQQISNNPDFNPFRPQLGHLQALVTQGTGYTGGGPHQQMLLNMTIPQKSRSVWSTLKLHVLDGKFFFNAYHIYPSYPITLRGKGLERKLHLNLEEPISVVYT